MSLERPSPYRHIFAAFLILACVLAVFAQTANDGFISLDDGQYVFANPHVGEDLSRADLRWALTDLSIANWHPVTLLSHQVMAAAFGLEPGPHHIANVALHAANALLLYVALFRFTGAFWPSLVATLLFAVHPLRVESVAWVSERKGLLCGLFALLALLAYERYARAPSAAKYALVAVLFVLGLLSKPALIPFPFALLLLDYWPLRRYPQRSASHLVLEKIPLVAIALGMTVVTFVAQAGTDTVQNTENYPVPVRLANAVFSYGMYLWATFVPVHLTLHYTHLRDALFGTPALYVSAAVLILMTAVSLSQCRARPWLIVGWLWFLGMLVPVIGLVQLADQARADRYTYLPQIGVLIMVAWTLEELRVRSGRPAVSRAIAAIVAIGIVALATLGFIQASRWKDDLSLFMYAVGEEPTSAQAYYGLGVAYLKRGDIVNAEAAFQGAVVRHPPVYQAYSNLGAIALRRGNFPQAAENFRTALELEPDEPDLMVNLGVALFNLGQREQARQLADDALRVDPAHPRALELRNATQ